MDKTIEKTVKIRHFTDEFIKSLEEKTPDQIEKLYRRGDYLYIGEASFKMVHYSAKSCNGKSRWVSYWSPLFDMEIAFDFLDDTTEVYNPPVTDWEKMGF